MDDAGTWVQEVTEGDMEGVMISGVALDDDEAKVTLDRVPDNPGVAAKMVFQVNGGDRLRPSGV